MEYIQNKFWAVGGGKGGVGKSIVSLMLGTTLARQGKKVILVDADLGGSNLHTLAGIRYPLYTLADFMNHRAEKIEEIVMNTPVDNMKLICGADDILGIANPKSTQKDRIIRNLDKLDADYIVLDLGAGTSFTTMDFFLYAANKIVVLTPQITSIQNAYGFIKASLYRGLNRIFSKSPDVSELIKRSASAGDRDIDSVEKLRAAIHDLGGEHEKQLDDFLEGLRIRTIVNMVREDREKTVGSIVSSVAKNYLSMDIENLGIVQYDKVLGMCINNMGEFLKNRKDSLVNMCFYDIVSQILKGARKAPAPNLPTQEQTPVTK